MLNPNSIIADLRMMPDAALQRMAMMHKQDPYLLPLIISEDTARKRLRAAAAAEMQQGPQPKVVDQALMAMGQQLQQAPQQAPGLPGLQAPNMQNMADGGIAGYDDAEEYAKGGAVGYAERGLVDPESMFIATSPYKEDKPLEGETYKEYEKRKAKEKELEAAAEAEQRPLARFLKKLSPESKLYKALYPSQAEVMSSQEKREVAPLEAAYRDPRRAQLDVPGATPAETAAPEAAPTPKVKKTPSDLLRERAAATKAPAAAPTAAPAAPATPIPAYTAPTADATAAGIATLVKDPNKDTEAAYTELRNMLAPERESLEQRKGTRGGEALLRAGLAMMSGTSPHALTNIGRGATEGLNAYAAAQKEDAQAAQQLRQAEMTLRMAQRQEMAGNRRDAMSLFQNAEQLKQAAVTSAQKAQEIKQTGEFQQGTLAVHARNAETAARKVNAYINSLDTDKKEKQKLMVEYTKIQNKVFDLLKNDMQYKLMTDPVQKDKYFQAQLRSAIAANPFLSSTLFAAAPSGTVRDPFAKDDEEE